MHKCPLCNFKHKEKQNVIFHIENEHGDSIPKNFSSEQFYYMLRTGREHGNCIECKKPTGWNAATGKYHRYCKNPQCKEAYKKRARDRMIGKYGKVSLLNDPEHQKKMLANRSISGKYTWSDGTEFTYTGSYEKDFLQFLDLFLNFESSDVMAPSPHTYYYLYKGEKKFYIPDFFIPSLNLEIEVKDGGDNVNTHAKIQAVDKVKEKLKDEVLSSQRAFSYIKVMNKEYDTFMNFLIAMKDHLKTNGEYAQIIDVGDGDAKILSRPVIESIHAEDYDIDEGLIREVMESTDSVSILSDLSSELEPSDAKNELDLFINSLVKDEEETLDDLLAEIDGLTNEFDMNVDSHLIDDYLKQFGKLDIVDRTPGFVSANTGRLFVDILDRTVVNPNLQYVMESLCGEFKKALTQNGTEEMIAVYKRDLAAMKYYFKLLTNKLGGNRTVEVMSVKDYLEDIVTEAVHRIEGNEVYPVYVLLTHSGTVLSNVIKTVTNKPYSHASISFDSSLEEMYSFGRKYKDNPFMGTFVSESIKSGLYEDVLETATYSLYVTFVTKSQMEAMKERLKYFQRDGVQFKYSFKGLIKYKMGKESDSVDRFFCSQFVDHILSAGKQYFDRHSSLVEPMDFAKHKEFYFVNIGVLKNYSAGETEAQVIKISKKAKLTTNVSPQVVYIGLEQNTIKQKKIKLLDSNSAAIELPASLEALRRSLGGFNQFTHYTVVPVKSFSKNSILAKTNDSVTVQTPTVIDVTNINSL